MKKYIREDSEFYKQYHETSPSLVMGLIILSFGLYIINWIFLRNKDFEELDENAPDSNRGAILMIIIPFGWFFLTTILKNLIFSPNNLLIGILEIVGWGIIIFLIYKYLFDFCLSYGRITKTNGLLWFGLFIISGIGIVGIIIENYYLIFLLPILMIIIPAMHSELNKQFHILNIKQKSTTFYQS